MDFRQMALDIEDHVIQWRRDFHQYPELAYEEVRTSKIIAQKLQELGMEVQTGVGTTGVVGILEGRHEGLTVMYRADMDALPIPEQNEVDYISKNDGIMHACGHDGHMAVALGVAQLFAQNRDKIHGRIKFVFQPGEEGAGGALRMLKDGVLDDPEPDIALGIHLWNPLPIGTVGMASGAIMSGSSTFEIKVHGKGGHAAMPHTTNDPVACAGQLIMALHTIVGRKMDAMAGAVILSVTGVHTSSYRHNIIPNTVEIMGTFRTFNAYASELLEQHVRDVTRSVCEAVGCTGEVYVKHLTIPVENDRDVTRRLRSVVRNVQGVQHIDTEARTMASEDFSYYLDEVPGMFFLIGASNIKKGLSQGHHHPRFNFDEDALALSVEIMSAAIADYVVKDDS